MSTNPKLKSHVYHRYILVQQPSGELVFEQSSAHLPKSASSFADWRAGELLEIRRRAGCAGGMDRQMLRYRVSDPL